MAHKLKQKDFKDFELSSAHKLSWHPHPIVE